MPVFLLTDILVYALLVLLGVYFYFSLQDARTRSNWGLIFSRPSVVVSSTFLIFFVGVALLDSIHFKPRIQSGSSTTISYANEPISVLDSLLKPLANAKEKSYSAPLAVYGFRKESIQVDGQVTRDFPRLKHGGAHLKNPEIEHLNDVETKSLTAFAQGLAVIFFAAFLLILIVSGFSIERSKSLWLDFLKGRLKWPWRSLFVALGILIVSGFWIVQLSNYYHVFGTDKTGNPVLIVALKSIRTALIIGSLTTLVVLPIALFLGVLAGYLRGWVDEFIQYIYTVLASIPDVLLIAATVLMLQVFIDKNQEFFGSALERADARLLFLCLILGVASFTGLCRLVRGEAMKLRELEYIKSAKSLGVSTPAILVRHLIPNLMHVVLINTVMQFSSFVLAEAVLSYVGVGVDPKTYSFGVMINTARMELAATPVVWWTLATAFVFMLLIVLCANLFADAVRDAFDPRYRLKSGI